MSSTNIELPDSLLWHARELAERKGIALEQFIASALAEKMAAWGTVEYLRERASRGDREKFKAAIDKVADAAPQEDDRITLTELVEASRHERREQQLSGLLEALRLLRAAGCRRVYINGSFVTSNERPNDVDVCWDIEGVDADALDPVFFNFNNQRAAQKARFGADFFPAQMREGVTGRTFLEFFQVDRLTGEPKGIIEVTLDDEVMIKDDRWYTITKAQAAELEAALESFSAQSANDRKTHPRLIKAQADALRSQLESLREALRGYEDIKTD